MKCVCCGSKKEKFIAPYKGYFECLVCGLIFRKVNREVDEIIKHYEAVDPKDIVAKSKRVFFEIVLRYLTSELGRNDSILDIGCGKGDFLFKAKNGGLRPCGVEISADLAIAANKKLKGEHVITKELRKAHFSDQYFKAITIWDSLVHFKEPYDDLKECFRILDYGGVIGIRVRNVVFQKVLYSIYSRGVKVLRLHGIRNPSVFHDYCFSKKSLEILLTRIGFKEIMILNSPLSTGDAYNYSKWGFMIKLTKVLVCLVTNLIFKLSGGRWVIGPSLLVWAKK